MAAPLTPDQQDDAYMHLIPEIEERFRATYDAQDLVYHVWGHGESTFDTTSQIRDELRANGVRGVPGLFMTHVDTKGHDNNLRKWFRLQEIGKNPYRSAEELHAIEGGVILHEAGVDVRTIAEYQQSVMGTKLGTVCRKVGQYTLCAGDMGNTGRDYETVMKPDTENLRKEKENLFQIEVDPLEFLIGSIPVIGGYHFVNLGRARLLEHSPTMRELHEGRLNNLLAMIGEAKQGIAEIGAESLATRLEALLAPFRDNLPQIWPLKKDSPTDRAAS